MNEADEQLKLLDLRIRYEPTVMVANRERSKLALSGAKSKSSMGRSGSPSTRYLCNESDKI